MFGRKKATARVETVVEPARELQAVPTPLFAAAQYVTIVSGGGRPNVFVSRIHDPVLCHSSAGDGVCFLLQSAEGISGKFYFFPSFASAWLEGEAAPRPQIPTEMIAAKVPNYAETLRSLFAMIPAGVDRIARVTN